MRVDVRVEDGREQGDWTTEASSFGVWLRCFGAVIAKTKEVTAAIRLKEAKDAVSGGVL
jgi:ribosomal protein L7/L12